MIEDAFLESNKDNLDIVFISTIRVTILVWASIGNS